MTQSQQVCFEHPLWLEPSISVINYHMRVQLCSCTNHLELITLTVTTPCSKKVVHQAHIDNLVNSQRIFKIPSLATSVENLRQNNH